MVSQLIDESVAGLAVGLGIFFMNLDGSRAVNVAARRELTEAIPLDGSLSPLWVSS